MAKGNPSGFPDVVTSVYDLITFHNLLISRLYTAGKNFLVRKCNECVFTILHIVIRSAEHTIWATVNAPARSDNRKEVETCQWVIVQR